MNDTTANQRTRWVAIAQSLATPVLSSLANRTLRLRMPIENLGGRDRELFTHLEAFGRLMAGIAPWLELGEPEHLPTLRLAREALDAICDPASPDFCDFTAGAQCLVDAAFLAQGLLRARSKLWEPLDERVKRNLIQSLRSTRRFRPGPSNWLLFSGMIEAALFAFGEPDWDRMRIDYALRQHDAWYKGDGFYGDGQWYHADYYNSFVIQPMLIDIIRLVGKEPGWDKFEARIWKRAARYSEVLERSISPEGTFPVIGRSIAYRFGALQTLAQMALLESLPAGVSPAQVCEALGAVIRRMMEAPGTFDEEGWLKIGFCGSQPELGEGYISTGSLYLCSTGLLPLGLPATNPFWSDAPAPWTSVKAWGGRQTAIDHALNDAEMGV